MVREIERVLQDEDMVLVRETDLEALPRFLSTMTPAKLHVILGDSPEEKADIDINVGFLGSGEILIPWRSESITEEMTNGKTHLEVGDRMYFFKSVRELFYGDVKAFIACTESGVS